jgi:hypothetical protein
MIILSTIAILAAMLFAFNSIDEKYITITKHTKYLNADIVYSVLRSIQHFEEKKGLGIQYLLNSQAITKAMIEDYADNLLFELGEFPSNSIKLDNRDFASLIDLHIDLLQGVAKSEVLKFVNTHY